MGTMKMLLILACAVALALGGAPRPRNELTCQLCVDIVTDLDNWLTDDKTEQEIVDFVKQLCAALGQRQSGSNNYLHTNPWSVSLRCKYKYKENDCKDKLKDNKKKTKTKTTRRTAKPKTKTTRMTANTKTKTAIMTPQTKTKT